MEYKHSNKPGQETLYGWYPGGNDSAIRPNAKDVYINLGVRPPREQSYTEADLMYNYHQSIKPSERANCFSIQQTPDEAVRPPWALNLASPSNQEYQDEVERQQEQRIEAIKNRTKSAPAIPTHRIILKIPNAQFNNLFDVEEVANNNDDKTNQNQNNNKNNDNNNFLNSNPNTESSSSFLQLAGSNFQVNGSNIADISGNAILVQSNSSNVQSSNQYSRPKTVNTRNQQKRLNSAVSRDSKDFSRPSSKLDSSSSSTFWHKSNTVTLHYATHTASSELPYHHKESPVVNSESKPPLPPSESEKKIDFLRAKSGNQESRLTTPKPMYRCKVIEVENFGDSTFKLLENLNPAAVNHTKRIKSQRCKTSSMQRNKNDNHNLLRAQTGLSQQRSKYVDPDGVDKGNNYTMADYHKELQLASPDKKPITQTSSQIELANRYASYKSESDLLVAELNRDEIKLAEGHWKDQLLGREKFLQKRPKYHVKIDPEKVRPDPPAPEIHYNSPETYFYNTVPTRKATFTINPNFRSEMLNVQKMGLQTRAKGKSTTNLLSHFAPVKYRRNYAFCY